MEQTMKIILINSHELHIENICCERFEKWQDRQHDSQKIIEFAQKGVCKFCKEKIEFKHNVDDA